MDEYIKELPKEKFNLIVIHSESLGSNQVLRINFIAISELNPLVRKSNFWHFRRCQNSNQQFPGCLLVLFAVSKKYCFLFG